MTTIIDDPISRGHEILNDSSFWFPSTYVSIKPYEVTSHFALGMGGETGEFVAEVFMPIELIDHEAASSELADLFIYTAGLAASVDATLRPKIAAMPEDVFADCGHIAALVISGSQVIEVVKKAQVCGFTPTCHQHAEGRHSVGKLNEHLTHTLKIIAACADRWQIDLGDAYMKKRQFNMERWGVTPDDHRWFGHPDLI